MTEIDPEYLKHQYLYVPWRDGVDAVGAGKALGLYVAALRRPSNHRLPAEVECELSRGVHQASRRD